MARRERAARARVEVSAIVHATEGEESVLGALSEMLGVDAGGVGRVSTPGHFGNRITTLSATVGHPESAVALRTLRAALGWTSRESAIESARRRLRGNGLAVRLDKQELVCRRAMLGGAPGGGGDVAVRVSVPVARGEDVAEALVDLLSA